MRSPKHSFSKRKEPSTRGTAILAVEEAIVAFIEKLSGIQIGPNVRIIDEGILDSFELVELLAFLENRFSVRFRARDTSGSKLATPRSIARWIAANGKKRARASGNPRSARRASRQRKGAA
jgi:acyl carrier protein